LRQGERPDVTSASTVRGSSTTTTAVAVDGGDGDGAAAAAATARIDKGGDETDDGGSIFIHYEQRRPAPAARWTVLFENETCEVMHEALRTPADLHFRATNPYGRQQTTTTRPTVSKTNSKESSKTTNNISSTKKKPANAGDPRRRRQQTNKTISQKEASMLHPNDFSVCPFSFLFHGCCDEERSSALIESLERIWTRRSIRHNKKNT
jgi:hypothetical protein